MGPLIYFATAGPQTLRVQVREDGLSIDQIVLSHEIFVSSSPGALKNDTQILAEDDGSDGPPPDRPAAAGRPAAPGHDLQRDRAVCGEESGARKRLGD